MPTLEKRIQILEENLTALREKATKKKTDSFDNEIQKLQQELTNLQIESYKNPTPWQRVQLSRHPQRPYTKDYIDEMCSDFIELHGDRLYGDDKAIIAGIGQVDRYSLFIIGHHKGRTTKERQERNFGMANPHGYRKALRIMKVAEKFQKPIVTLIDTAGAYPGIEAEERGQAEAIAKNIQSMFDIKVPIITVIIGEGASGGALGVGVADKVFMLENSWYSVISPESCSSILWKSWDYKEQASQSLSLTAQDMYTHGLIDKIIPEPIGGAHKDIKETTSRVKLAIVEELTNLIKLPPDQLIKTRIDKFTSIGVFDQLDHVYST